MYAALRAIPIPEDVVARVFHAASLLREHRGDGHIAAMVNEGVTGLEAHLLQAAAGRFPPVVIRQVRGWSEGEWAGAADALCARGLLSRDGTAGPDGVAAPDGALSLAPSGRAVLDTIEARTDERAWTGGLAVLGERGVEEVLALLRPSARAVAASGMLPDINPTGLPYPG